MNESGSKHASIYLKVFLVNGLIFTP